MRLAKTRIDIQCSHCNKDLRGYCLFSDRTYIKYCLECGLEKMSLEITRCKEMIKTLRRKIRYIVKHRDELDKYNMAVGLTK